MGKELNPIQLIKEKKDWYFEQLNSYKAAYVLLKKYKAPNKVFREAEKRIKECEKIYNDFNKAYKLLKIANYQITKMLINYFYILFCKLVIYY